MSATITYDTTTVHPLDVDGWSQARESRNMVHPLISGDQEVTHRPALARAGTLRLIFTDEAEALAAETLHNVAPFLDIASTDRGVANGRYVVPAGGRVTLTLDDETRDAWFLEVDFCEVSS